MGIFDSIGNGWLSYASQPNPNYNKQFSISDLLEQARKFYSGGQALPSLPPMPAPINVGSLPQPINRAGLDERAYGTPQPGNPLQPPQTITGLPPEAANAMAQAQPQQTPQPSGFPNPLQAIGNILGGIGGVLNPSAAATEKALIAAGAPPEVARAAGINPAVLSAVGPRYLGENFKIVPYGATAVNQKGQVLYQNDAGGSATLDEPTLAAMAKQYRAGDTSVMQNLGRGIQGAQNIVKLRAEIAKQNASEGVSGEQQAFKNAEFFGTKAAQRTVGNREATIGLAATEMKQVLPVVMEASKRVDRTNYPALNKIIQMAQTGTGDPNIVAFGQGVNTLVNLYSRAISPTGQPTVSDKDHAREILNKAWSAGQFEAAVGMMQKEVDAAISSPNVLHSTLRDSFLNRESSLPATQSGQTTGFTPPPNWQFSPSRKQYRDPQGNIYDVDGRPVK